MPEELIRLFGCHLCWALIQFGVGLYLFEHSLIAVDVNQSLHENLGGYFGFGAYICRTSSSTRFECKTSVKRFCKEWVGRIKNLVLKGQDILLNAFSL